MTVIVLCSFTSCKGPEDTGSSDAAESVIATDSNGEFIYGFEDEPEENSSDFKIADEEKAVRISSYSHRNIFGIEKSAVFSDSIVLVFDKNTASKSVCFRDENVLTNDTLEVAFNNLDGMDLPYSLEEKDGKYVVTAGFTYSESDLIDPERDVKIAYAVFRDGRDSMHIRFEEDNLELAFYTAYGDEHIQTYDAASGKWKDVKSKFHDTGSDSSVFPGSTTALDLVSPNSMGIESYSFEKDDVIYELYNYYDGYLYISIINTGDENKIVGGSRYICELKDGVCVDSGRRVRNSSLNGVMIKDFPPVTIQDVTELANNPNAEWQETPVIELKENETFEIGAGQFFDVRIMASDFDSFDSGNFRLYYGEAVIDFKMDWETIW